MKFLEKGHDSLEVLGSLDFGRSDKIWVLIVIGPCRPMSVSSNHSVTLAALA